MPEANRMHIIELQQQAERRYRAKYLGSDMRKIAPVLQSWRCEVIRGKSDKPITVTMTGYNEDDARAGISRAYGGSYRILSMTKLLQKR